MSVKVVVRHTVRPKNTTPVRTYSNNTVYKMNSDGSYTATKTRSVKNNV